MNGAHLPSPEVLTARNRVAGLSRKRTDDDPVLIEARQQLAAALRRQRFEEMLPDTDSDERADLARLLGDDR